MNIQTLKSYIQSANVNFLIGSGCSRPFLSVLGNVEKWLTELSEDKSISEISEKIIKASVYKAYFKGAIFPNFSMAPVDSFKGSVNEYSKFLSIWNEIINKRGSRLLSKRVNVFTTNVDTLIERAAESGGIELNDGFRGSVAPSFDESNFNKTISKRSLHFQNVSELPVFDLIKLHGSINWKSIADNKIENDFYLRTVELIEDELEAISIDCFIELNFDDGRGNSLPKSYAQLKSDADAKAAGIDPTSFDKFLKEYEKLIMVNPTKMKFVTTVMDMHFYELMRIYSNSLEKENTLLFTMGFSFADEHLANLTMRAANANPTLQIIIFAFNDAEEDSLKSNLKIKGATQNNNIYILTPMKLRNNNANDEWSDKLKDIDYFSLEKINKLFRLVDNQIPVSYGK